MRRLTEEEIQAELEEAEAVRWEPLPQGVVGRRRGEPQVLPTNPFDDEGADCD